MLTRQRLSCYVRSGMSIAIDRARAANPWTRSRTGQREFVVTASGDRCERRCERLQIRGHGPRCKSVPVRCNGALRTGQREFVVTASGGRGERRQIRGHGPRVQIGAVRCSGHSGLARGVRCHGERQSMRATANPWTRAEVQIGAGRLRQYRPARFMPARSARRHDSAPRDGRKSRVPYAGHRILHHLPSIAESSDCSPHRRLAAPRRERCCARVRLPPSEARAAKHRRPRLAIDAKGGAHEAHGLL